ncbi:uncharacterized protein BXZ73DRAFT_92691 [Epithele typhae]|uniref:uncharacterized protein n=1 Tax=Epithele typhae TaxID=378194 RepID=UPI002007E413|nr:uncharacterized protein BXZ73DRAFT_92691 [Epithele typhae]KAH9915031.1 hypothetical protein BXZ73DRAFT_92691 [Epithele typhae]
MRIGVLPALVVLGASLANASPIRIVVTEVSSSVRYGHAVPDADANDAAVARIAINQLEGPLVAVSTSDTHPAGARHWCQGMRTKALDASNALRQILGLEPITVAPHHRMGPIVVPLEGAPHHPHGGHMPPPPLVPFVGTAVRPGLVAEGGDPRGPMWAHHRGHRMMRQSFLRRVHHALMTLGPWEGRAVAFVLGCGIGVLLRMVWVVVLLTARAFRGTREDETVYDVVFDEAELLVAPPQYTTIEGSEAVPVATQEKEKN